MEQTELNRHCMVRVEVFTSLRRCPYFPWHNRYMDVLRSCGKVPIVSLGEVLQESNPFRINEEGLMRMYFTAPEWNGKEKDKSVVFRSAWTPLQQWRRVHGVVFLVSGQHSSLTSEADITQIQKEIEFTVSSKFPESVHRVIIVNPPDDSLDWIAAVPQFCVIPKFVHEDETNAKLQFALSDLMSQMARDFVRLFRDRIKALIKVPVDDCVKNIRESVLSTGADPAKDEDSRQQRKEKLEARSQKAQADICLMVGSFTDAITLYEAPVVKSSDPLWKAAALEGLACAINNLPRGSRSHKEAEVLDLLNEASQVYGRHAGVVQMEIETLLELAHYTIERKIPDGLKKITNALSLVSKIPPNFVNQRSSLYRMGATLCSYHSWKRKAAFYLKRAAECDAEKEENAKLCFQELVTALQFVGSPLVVQENFLTVRTQGSTREIGPKAWPGAMQSILESFLYVVKTRWRENLSLISQLCMFMLTGGCEYDDVKQCNLFQQLESSAEMIPPDFPLCLEPFRIVTSARKIEMEKHLAPMWSADPNGPKFFHNPYVVKDPFCDFVCGTKCGLEFSLFNPFGFPLELTDVALIGDGITHSPVALSSVRISKRSSIKVLLYTIPLTPGLLSVKGIQMSWKATHDYRLRSELSQPLMVDCLAPLPILTIDSFRDNNLLIHPGQIVQSQISIRNVGDIPIDNIQIEFHTPKCTVYSCTDCYHNTKFQLASKFSKVHLQGSEGITIPIVIVGSQRHAENEIEEVVQIRVLYSEIVPEVIQLRSVTTTSYYSLQRLSQADVRIKLGQGLIAKKVFLSQCARNICVDVLNAPTSLTTFTMDRAHTLRSGLETTLTIPVSRQEKGLLHIGWESDRRSQGKLILDVPPDLRAILVDELEKVKVVVTQKGVKQNESTSVFTTSTFSPLEFMCSIDNQSGFDVRISACFSMPRASVDAVESALLWSGRMGYTVVKGGTATNDISLTVLTAGEYYYQIELQSSKRKMCHTFIIQATET
eukprot:PhF_6_TR37034/c0_g1_i1/m.54172/K20306/TRAPPC9, TRS120; trafficking protein particle complex subunit 9